MKLLRVALAATLLAWQAGAAPTRSPDAVHLLLTDFAGRTLDYRISLARVQALPDWHPQSGKPPPLRGDRAVAIAVAWMKKQAPRFDGFAVFRIELTRVTYINRGELWHYVIYADAVSGTRRIPHLGMQAVVLLDGSVVEPIED